MAFDLVINNMRNFANLNSSCVLGINYVIDNENYSHVLEFSKLMKDYEEIDKHIFRIESDEEPTSDEYIRDLKKQRLKLKDELHGIIKEE